MILVSGGMGNFRPFREWLDQTYLKKVYSLCYSKCLLILILQVVELNNMTSACALGTAIYAGILNTHGKDALQLADLPQYAY